MRSSLRNKFYTAMHARTHARTPNKKNRRTALCCPLQSTDIETFIPIRDHIQFVYLYKMEKDMYIYYCMYKLRAFSDTNSIGHQIILVLCDDFLSTATLSQGERI